MKIIRVPKKEYGKHAWMVKIYNERDTTNYLVIYIEKDNNFWVIMQSRAWAYKKNISAITHSSWSHEVFKTDSYKKARKVAMAMLQNAGRNS